MRINNILGGFLIIFAIAVFLPGNVFAWNLQGSCASSPPTATVGTPITWTATQTSTLQPSQGHYTWSWSGTDGLSGGTQSVVKSYGTSGTKTATVVITIVLNSGEIIDSITVTCSVVITTPPPQATLKVIKQVINNNGGTKTPSNFTLRVKSVGIDVSGSPAAGSGTGTIYNLAAGIYVVSEDEPTAGYTKTGISGDCASSGSVTLASGDSKTCTITNDDNPPQEFSASCAVTPGTGLVGTLFSWSASASGGVGNYTYLWSGNESLSATSESVSKSYASTGTKTGTVVITSGSQSITKNCTVVVTATEVGFDGICSVSPSTVYVGETVNWGAGASGGTGTYSFSWSGDEALSGITAALSKTYSSAGTKLGTVTITSGSNSISRTCSVSITPRPCVNNCGGGGYNPPNVVLFKKATTSPLASASLYLSQTHYSPYASASVYLSQIPYTGIVADNTRAILYIFLLLALSGLLAYYIVRKKSDQRLFKDNLHLVNSTGAVKRNYSPNENDVSEFISWLVSDNSQKVFDYLRSLNHQGKDIAKFVTSVASELDLVYRNRIDKNIITPPERVVKMVAHWDNKNLEEAISTLVGSVDESYQSNYTPIKLAMAKIMKMKP